MQKIKTINQQAQQDSSFQIPRALTSTVINTLQERIKIEVIEPFYNLYRNFWYLVKKNTPSKYWLINIALELNRITVKDANLTLSADKFLEKFASFVISSLINFFSRYNQVKLDKKS